MAQFVVDLNDDRDKLVKLIGDEDGEQVNSVGIINLLSKENVNMQVNGIPLILFYFKETRYLDFGILKAFVNHGCDLNVQDEHGKTPLHRLFQRNKARLLDDLRVTIENLVSFVELFLSNGADPCLVDNDGNNVLMTAINSQCEDWYKVIKPLISNSKNTRQLLTETNKLGFNFWSLCIESDCLEPVLLELKLIAQSMDMMMVDEDGNNVLHNLFSKLPENQSDKWTENSDKTPDDLSSSHHFSIYLEYLVKTGAKVSQKNNDGLVPLQMALLHLDNRITCHLNQLELLIPSEEVLSEHVPWPRSIVGLFLVNGSDEFIPFLCKLVKSGLNCSHEQVLPTALRLKNNECFLVMTLIRGGAIATIDDIKHVLKRIGYLNLPSDEPADEDYVEVLCILLEDGLPDNLVIILNDAIPGLVTYIIRCTGKYSYTFNTLIFKLLRKGLTLNIGDFRTALASYPKLCIDLLKHVDSELIVELNSECPSVFEQIITFDKIGQSTLLCRAFVEAGIHVTVDLILELFNNKRTIGNIDMIVRLMTDEVKGQLKETLPNAIGRLIQLIAQSHHNSDDCAFWKHFSLIEMLIRFGFKVTIDDLIKLYDKYLPFTTLLLLVNGIDEEDKGQLKYRIPDAIGKLIAIGLSQTVCRIWSESCAELIDTLVGLGIKITANDLKIGVLPHNSDRERFPIACLIKHLDVSLKDVIQREMPGLLVEVFCSFLTSNYYTESLLMNTMVLLLDKFELDINYSHVTHGTFLYVLVRLSNHFPPQHKEIQTILEIVLARSDLDLDKPKVTYLEQVDLEQLVQMQEQGTVLPIRPIDLALQLKQYNLVNKLIVAGANCDGLDLTKLRDDQITSINTARLLFISGHYVDIGGNSRLTEWIETLPVSSLQERAALAVRKNTSRTVLSGIIDQFVFPRAVLDYFKLAHVQLECEIEDIEYYSDDSEEENLMNLEHALVGIA